ncbi:MAG TPA: 1-deoxy-D-xylulose-5-phosphate synthase [Pseudomonadales bacterium]|nr:1-deoxy-D-xylulose-5-phosphate synthase [Pseudomonadales bacterium]HNF08874.1 1-deoxy-D-xylulose-5-phosphate synthase [Pseudomonadales bacterium]HNF74197.1 1-deoxy-D-xylulose-5-phosphate synthase [Pseudomonadales bacterium]
MPVTFDEIPRQRPATPLLDQIDIPAQLRDLPEQQLPQLARELREYLLYTVGRTGGHFGAGLGVVELTIALHYVFDTPHDRLVWDVGHQAYPHKILTGRREAMAGLRQQGGISGFPKRSESDYDTFGVGHSSTSIGAALGMALASRLKGEQRHHVAVIGDGAMTAGMAFEALNHAAHVGNDLLVVLNDNDMSISRNVGGLSQYLARIWAGKTYNSVRQGSKRLLSRIPPFWELARRTEEYMKGMVAPGVLFEELGFNYIGPLDGHDLPALVKTLSDMKFLPGPRLLHVITRKGKGFAPAEQDPIGYHAISKLETRQGELLTVVNKGQKYSSIFGQWLCDMAEQEPRLIGITPAMAEGSDLVTFSQRYPQRYCDVGIAEQHAVTLAAGMACEGAKPVVAIYSTFLQRAYDQLIHDVAIQNLDVLFALDRAGLVGEDGATHAGSFDLSYLRAIPNLLVMAPSDENETRQMLYTGFIHPGPAAVRYPRGTGPGAEVVEAMSALEIGRALVRRQGREVALLAFGSMVRPALAAAERLDATVVDMRFVKPIDEALVLRLAESHQLLVTIEENVVMGGAGSAVNECLAAHGVLMAPLNLGLPDRFIDHGKTAALLAECGLDAEGICRSVEARLPRRESAAGLG